MANTTETIVINATQEAAEAIRNEINAQSNSQSHLTERRNLDGDTTAWILIANIALQTLPHVLGFIKDHFASKFIVDPKFSDIFSDRESKNRFLCGSIDLLLGVAGISWLNIQHGDPDQAVVDREAPEIGQL